MFSGQNDVLSETFSFVWLSSKILLCKALRPYAKGEGRLLANFRLQPTCIEQSLVKFSSVKGQTHVHSADYFFSSERRPRRRKMKE